MPLAFGKQNRGPGATMIPYNATLPLSQHGYNERYVCCANTLYCTSSIVDLSLYDSLANDRADSNEDLPSIPASLACNNMEDNPHSTLRPTTA